MSKKVRFNINQDASFLYEIIVNEKNKDEVYDVVQDYFFDDIKELVEELTIRGIEAEIKRTDDLYHQLEVDFIAEV